MLPGGHQVIVFKVKKKTSAGTAAKIQFQMKKAAATAKPAPETPPVAADSSARDSTTGR